MIRRSGPVDKVAMRKQRLLQYRGAVQQGYAKQKAFTADHPVGMSGTVLADVERHATCVPAAVTDRFSKYQASLVDERKYQRLRTMA